MIIASEKEKTDPIIWLTILKKLHCRVCLGDNKETQKLCK